MSTCIVCFDTGVELCVGIRWDIGIMGLWLSMTRRGERGSTFLIFIPVCVSRLGCRPVGMSCIQ